MPTTESQVEKWAKEVRKGQGIWDAEESEDGKQVVVESGLGKFTIPKPLKEITKADVELALDPEIIKEMWKGHGHGHDAYGNDIDDSGKIIGKSEEGHGHSHDGHGHDDHGHKAHGHDSGHAHDGGYHGDCCDGHGEGHKEHGEGHKAHGGHDGHGEGHKEHGGGHDHGHGHGHGHAHGHKEGEECAKIVGVGVVKVAGETFSVDREGQCEGGKVCEFGVERVGEGKAAGFEGWVENAAGERVSDIVKAEAHGAHWHYNVTAEAGKEATKFVLKLGDEVGKVDLHPGAAPCHDGISSPLFDKSGAVAGFLELKLHDDAGDLEAWICKDGAMTQPLDVPADTVIKASFLACDGRSLELKVRNNDKNEDEDEKPNMRDGNTNYFIFPGETGADASWLVGEKFRSMVVLTFTAAGQTYETSPFTIVGHSLY